MEVVEVEGSGSVTRSPMKRLLPMREVCYGRSPENGRARGKASTAPLEEELTWSGGGGIGTKMPRTGSTKSMVMAPQREDMVV